MAAVVALDLSRMLAGLNDPQREAVRTTEGPLLVLAGAGSGKTRVITCRIAQLLAGGVRGKEILGVTFTNKAADEMRERVRALVGDKAAAEVHLSTFHSLGLRILQTERAALGFDGGFVVYDAADQLGVVREILRRLRVDDRRWDVKAVLARVSRWKEALGAARPREADDYDQIAAEVAPRYAEALKRFHAVDYDDLIVGPVRLFEEHPELRRRWQGRFRYLLVDEYQDTNAAQLALVAHLAAAHRNLCVVGDDDQSIYAWRGADRRNVLEFERVFPGAKVILLEENYRSTPTILDAANAVIRHNRDRREKTLFRRGARGEPVALVTLRDGDDEARFVAEEIDAMRARGLPLADAAILYRSNNQARPFEEELRARGLPYVLVGGQAFYERKEVKDVIAYLRAALAPRDEISLRRILNYPARGLGDVAVGRLEEHARRCRCSLREALRRAGEGEIAELAPRAREAAGALDALLARQRAALVDERLASAEVTRRVVEEIALEDDLRDASPSMAAARRRMANVDDFIASLARHESQPGASGLAEYLHRLTLAARDDDDGGAGERLTLTTLHGAKGREWRVVFLVGLEEELLPHARTLAPIASDMGPGSGPGEGATDLEEERRLLYVGITRAKERLYLTHARARERGGRFRPRTPSRFLAEIPAELLELRDLADGPSPGEQATTDMARATLADLLRLADEE